MVACLIQFLDRSNGLLAMMRFLDGVRCEARVVCQAWTVRQTGALAGLIPAVSGLTRWLQRR